MNIVRLVVLFLLPSNAYSLGWSGWTKITEVYAGTGPTPIFELKSFGSSGTGCSKSGYIRFDTIENNDSKPGSSRAYSTLLAAFVAGRDVNVQTISCSSDYPCFRSLRIR